MKRRVVITGCGVISPIGCTPEALWDSLEQGRSGVVALESVPTATLPVKSGGEVRGFTGQIDDFGELSAATKKNIRKGLKVMCREIQMGVAASQLALANAAFDLEACVHERMGVVFGSDYIMTLPEEFAAGVAACRDDAEQLQVADWPLRGMPQVTPLWLLKYLPNMPACHVAIYNDLRGPNNSLTVREASANLALAEAFSTIARDSADQLLVGATGSRIHPLRTVHTVLQEEVAAGDSDPAALSRPFAKDRCGMVIGEGAATLMLEEKLSAEKRGAVIWGELLGYGSSAVMGRDGIADRSRAMANAMRRALAMAEMSPGQVGHVHAHGLATRTGDVAEARAIEQVFQETGTAVPVVAAKSYFGNLGAASGMVELICSLMSLRHGTLFRTLNCHELDPECPVALVRETGVSAGDSVLSVNVTPQGQAAAVVVGRLS